VLTDFPPATVAPIGVSNGKALVRSARKYREARDLLLEAGFISEVTPAMATRPAEYELTERMLTPSRVG